MSKLIKSSRVILGERQYNISADVTAPYSDEQTTHLDSDYHQQRSQADQLLIEAENTAEAILNEAEAKAHQLITRAEDDAAEMAAEAVAKAKQLYDNKREEAQQEGYAQGFDAGQSEAQVLIDEALMIKEEWTINKNQFIKRMEQDIITLCLKTVQNVINREVSDQAYILDLINKGIANLTFTASLVVRVSEYDYDYVAANKSKVLAMVDGVENIEIRKDLSLDHTDCVIDTDTGSLDIGLTSQIDQVKQIFDAILAGD